ncbi:MAG: hypothetical protein NC089_01765 [Bacteroides sp.]|nr:hypothetical protein [Bacteroides sp.]MCM1548851.1 hypothetical protein [Clostridium sp.]
MSATVAAALKKIAVALLGNKKALKTVCGIMLGIIIVIVTPIAVLLAMFTGELNMETQSLKDKIEIACGEEMQRMEDMAGQIKTAILNAGFTAERADEAQMLYFMSLYDAAEEDGFLEKLVGCFANGQSDAELIANVNATFGTDISAEMFTKVMDGIRMTYIDISDYASPSVKNNIDLAKWAVHAEQSGWGYVWGTYGEVLDGRLFDYKKEQYPEEVGGYADFISANWYGKRTADCVGLIKGYGWLNTETRQVEYGTNGMPDIGADAMYENAVEKGTMDTMPEIPGLAVWHEGHIGIYIGNGEVVEAMGTRYGVVRTQLAGSRWTHWLKVPYITYGEEGSEGDNAGEVED